MGNQKKVTKTYITTEDTKETYTFPPDDGVEQPQLWEVVVYVLPVEKKTGISSGGINSYSTPNGAIYLERQTLVNHGMMPVVYPGDKPPADNPSTAEDLIIQLLETVGYYPES